MPRLDSFQDDDEGCIELPAPEQPETSEPESVQFSDLSQAIADDFLSIKVPKGSTDCVRVAALEGAKRVMRHLHSIWGAESANRGVYRCLTKWKDGKAVGGQLASCCRVLTDENAAKTAYAIPVVRYLGTDRQTGKFSTGSPGVVPFQIAWLKLTPPAVKSISSLIREDEDSLTNFDFMLRGRGVQPGYDYVRMSQDGAFYAKDPAMKTAVLQAAKPYLDGKEILKRLGRVLKPEEFLEKFAPKGQVLVRDEE